MFQAVPSVQQINKATTWSVALKYDHGLWGNMGFLMLSEIRHLGYCVPYITLIHNK
jgi:hypothetical protein